ncbi:MAG: thioredoxin [Oscillospiraceae bacterium]
MAVKDVTLDNFASEISQSEKPVLIDFYADWCMPCKMLSPEVEAFSRETTAVNVCRINVDVSSDLAAMYGIMSIPTLVITVSGKEVARQTGGCEKKDIENFCNANI